MKGVDYSFARPGGAAIKAAGFDFAVRYVPYNGDEGKGLTADELADLRDNGLAVALVWESVAERPKAGRAGGIIDASASASALGKLGFPGDRPVYFAVDYNAQRFDDIDDYLDGCASILGLERVGVYGSYAVVDHCSTQRTAAWYWQTYAWSGGQRHPARHLYQYLNGQTINGGAVDYNLANADDFGQWGIDMTKEEIERIAREAAEKFCGENFRAYLDLALNGGPNGFTDADGKPLPLIHDKKLTEHLDNHTAGQTAEVAEHQHRTTVTAVTSGGVVR